MEAPLVDVPEGGVTTPRGFLAGAASARIRDDYPPGRLDLALLRSERPCAAAGVYTTNRLQGPPLRVTQRHLADGRAQAVIANSGIANALTGADGLRDAEEMARLAAEKLGVAVEDVAVASTGVTGWPLPMDRIRAALPGIELSRDGGASFARAVMTTDTVPKQAAVRFTWDGVEYAVGGAAKGSGMIHPDMATMLAFITTDAPIPHDTLSSLLIDVTDESFNMITIDGDTSPEDMVLLLANGAAAPDAAPFDAAHPALGLVRAAIARVSVSLARQLARDGEGAGKLLEVRVDGADSVEDARRVAKAVVGSLLVKTAVHGNDPNWGRVVVAAGYSGAELVEDRLSLSIQDVEVYRSGVPVPFDAAALSRALAQEEVRMRLDLGLGDGSATGWGCDLTEDYVRINAEYTT
jgi:glutamate N-acetyltransferase/amino-acid N-acetyltransferase